MNQNTVYRSPPDPVALANPDIFVAGLRRNQYTVELEFVLEIVNQTEPLALHAGPLLLGQSLVAGMPEPLSLIHISEPTRPY